MLANPSSLTSQTFSNRKMGCPQVGFLFIRSIMILFISCVTVRMNFGFSSSSSSLRMLSLDGHLELEQVQNAARDFGNRYQYQPTAILHPDSVSDIATILKHIWEMGPSSGLTVAARGHGHSLQGQAQAHRGIVINMEALRRPKMQVHNGNFPHVDVSGGELWINILFHSVLGGLGQFGIITRAKVLLEPAPDMVKWIRVLYTDFAAFTRDQEYLISVEETFDYIEGFAIINRTGLLNNWRSSFNPQDPVQASKFKSDGRTLFCLEMAKYFKVVEDNIVNQEVENLLSQLIYIPSTLFVSEVTYVEFLDRVHASEVKLRSKGLWEVPHPWLNLLIPKSKIYKFAEEVFGNILTETSNGPILIYPVNRSKWDNRTSIVIPEEDIFYLVAFLTSAVPSSTGTDGLEYILTQNRRILEFCETASLGMKQYLPHYTTREEWRSHFGPQWEEFVQRKSAFDPLAILAPGQRIFQKAVSLS